MGNTVGIEKCTFEEIVQSVTPPSSGEERSGRRKSSFPTDVTPRYRSILWIWRYSLDSQDDLCTFHAPLNMHDFTQFSDENCYIVLHLFLSPELQATLPAIEKIDLNSSVDNQSLLGCTEVAVSAKQQLTPRGQSTSFGGIHSVANSLQSETRNSDLQYDIYMWHGNECPPLVKANALAKAFDMDGRLKRIALHALVDLMIHGRDTIVPLDSVLCLGSEMSEWYRQSQGNHLFVFLNKLYAPAPPSDDVPPTKKSSKGSRTRMKKSSSKGIIKSSIANASSSCLSSTPASEKISTRANAHRRLNQSRERKSSTRAGLRVAAASTGSGSPSAVRFEAKESSSSLKKSTSKREAARPAPTKASALPKDALRLSMRSVSLPAREIERVTRLAQGMPSLDLQLNFNALNSSTSVEPLSPPESKASKLARYNKICSRITDDLFIGSDYIAQHDEILRQHGVTHVLNCAGTVCDNYHPQQFDYKMLHLFDGTKEDITSLFYDVLEFMDDAVHDGGKVFVHCHQGVSRSSAMLILYLMWRNNQVYQATHEQVKAIREIVNPNAGFTCQLLNWWNRRTKNEPRLYIVLPHCKDTPQQSALREIPDFKPDSLDPRGAFLLWKGSRVWLWRGSQCSDILLRSARRYARLLVRFESATTIAPEEAEGSESSEFCALFGVDKLDAAQSHSCWDDLYNLSSECSC